MRELKFRAWDNTKKEWTLNIMECVSSSRGDIWLEPALKSHEVAIEQYTGLKDENGQEIYEGDIVEYIWDFCGEKRKNNYVVEWLSGKVEYYPCSVDSGFTLPDSVEEYYVVIGNIHENPELCEGKK